ncbi:putative telomere-binding alpha subunit central domain-containing protein [Golovinomyces cichoracearum]|uniref:Protection of telomeres protein 1 n=1 Tax=Golovinomyces cichoracearum TaxID=62708 RepID=A0A420IE00_9PEZI|nr:putative telomere-binding alpha subunit central domain-containing protein [Golovinomyces cichoracearum]
MTSSQLDGYFSIQQIKDFSEVQIGKGKILNVIGLINDFKSAIATNGSDWKCSIEIVDHSLRDKSTGLEISVFRPPNCMPSTPSVSDVIIVKRAKAQWRNGYISLLTHKQSTIHILPAKDVPEKISDASKVEAFWISSSYKHNSDSNLIPAPSVSELRLAISLSKKKSDIIFLASSPELSTRNFQISSQKKRDKLALVQDLQPGSFYDVIGEVRKLWETSDTMVTVYLSDYTENSRLFQYAPEEIFEESSPEFRGGDGKESSEMSTLVNKTSCLNPHGRLIIQITIWDSDADFVRRKVDPGNWILIKNVRIKIGPNDIIEGSVHAEEGKIHVQKLINKNTSSDIDLRWKTALLRKKAWWNKFEEKLTSERKNPSIKAGRSKRKHDDDGEISPIKKKNSKQRRREDRARAEKKSARICAKMAAQIQLNKHSKQSLLSQIHKDTHIVQKVHHDYPDKTVVSLSDVLTPCLFSQPGSETINAPFTNRKYKVNVRVVDYFPDLVEDFATVCSAKDRNNLSDGEESDRSNAYVKNKWEWRFSLLLEESSSIKKTKKERIWVVIDNDAAKYLLNIEEAATNLRENSDLLLKVQQQLFQLWGNLEEQKLKNLQEIALSFHLQNTYVGDQPDPDSDNEKEKSNYQLNKTRIPPSDQIRKDFQSVPPNDDFATILKRREARTNTHLNNIAFTCCIQQFGVKVFEDDPTQANAGHRKRWQRMFGLFGTKIL